MSNMDNITTRYLQRQGEDPLPVGNEAGEVQTNSKQGVTLILTIS